MKIRTLPAILAILYVCSAREQTASAQTWLQTSAPTNAWTAVASSADGTSLVAAGAHFIYTSTDYGSTWISNNALNTSWTSVASSADGSRLVATGGGAIFTNSGTTWTLAYAAPKSGPNYQQNISSVASSADGVTLVAASSFGDPISSPKPLLYVSANSGTSWSIATNSASDGQFWLSVASSGDGTKMAASTLTGGFFASANSGTAWSSNTVAPFSSLAMSADGNRFAGTSPIGLFYSVNAGATWAPQLSGPAITNRIACSTNGIVLFGLGRTNIYSSFNGGTTWTTNTAPRTNWTAIAVSKDGLRAVAAVSGGGIYILNPPPLFITNASAAVSLLWSTNYPLAVLGLFESTNLAPANWVVVPNIPVVSNVFYDVILPATNNQLFFRLEAP